MEYDRKLVLENGKEFYGKGFGADKESISEIVFNTGVTGYQEDISDLSYTDQMVVMTYPLIGNYGITDDDFESKQLTLSGLIVREYNNLPSNFRYTRTLSEILEDNNVPGVSEVDTRMIARIIRDEGSQKAIITSAKTSLKEALRKINEYEIPKNAVERVSSKKKWYSRTANPKYNIVIVDCGMKLNIARELNKRGCNVTVVPYNTSYDEIKLLKPDGIIISNGPGNPENVKEVIDLVRKLRGKFPMFGICLGYQLICLAYGAKVIKMKFGHKGGNHPVKELKTGKIEITSQNHSYAVDMESLRKTKLELTHINLLYNTTEGAICEAEKVICVQFHPEGAPGPEDGNHLFDEFINMINK